MIARLAPALLWSWLARAGVRTQQLPKVSVDLAACVPAWTLRIAGAVTASGCVLLVAPGMSHWLVVAVFAVVARARPVGVVCVILAVGAGLLLLTSTTGEFDPRVLLLVFGLHLAVETVVAVGDLPWAARVERRVLVGLVKRFLAVQAPAQALALLGAWAVGSPPSQEALTVAAGALVAAMAWVAVSRLQAGR